MCFDQDSRPPITPIAGGATDARDFTLQSADGTRFAAYGARATRPTGAGMLVLPDVRGLHTYYKELALRFAEVGVDAVAIDFFGRTDKTGDRSDAFEYLPHVGQTTPANPPGRRRRRSGVPALQGGRSRSRALRRRLLLRRSARPSTRPPAASATRG